MMNEDMDNLRTDLIIDFINGIWGGLFGNTDLEEIEIPDERLEILNTSLRMGE